MFGGVSRGGCGRVCCVVWEVTLVLGGGGGGFSNIVVIIGEWGFWWWGAVFGGGVVIICKKGVWVCAGGRGWWCVVGCVMGGGVGERWLRF